VNLVQDKKIVKIINSLNISFIMPSLLITSIYVFLLNENKYFISKMKKEQINMLTENKYNNLSQIFENGIEWLTTYPIINTMNIIESDNIDSIVKYHMSSYGIDNVRGGKYYQMILDDELLDELQNEQKNDYLENFNTISAIDEEIENLYRLNEESIKLINKYEPLINIKFCYKNQPIICNYFEENFIPFNIIKDNIDDLIKSYYDKYNIHTTKEWIFYLIKKIYIDYNKSLDENKINNYSVDIKWLNLKNIVMDARAIHKSIIIDHGDKEIIDNKIHLLFNKRINLLQQYI